MCFVNFRSYDERQLVTDSDSAILLEYVQYCTYTNLKFIKLWFENKCIPIWKSWMTFPRKQQADENNEDDDDHSLQLEDLIPNMHPF